MNAAVSFPAFRKYTGLNTWFKITGYRHFVEIRQVGARFVTTEIYATQFPEIQLIRDMLDCYEGRWEPITEQEFESASR